MLHASDDMLRPGENWFRTKGYSGDPLLVPREVVTESDTYLRLSDDAAVKRYYDEHGYVVLRNLLPDDVCDAAMRAFQSEVKNFDGHLYRQPSGGAAEKHRLTEGGFMENSILNPHDLPSRTFASFRANSLGTLTHANVQRAVKNLLGEPGMLVQSMYFEGNPNTWPHQDTYYLDSEHLGSMVAAWMAVEDISPGAGRFYVCPGSHKIDMKRNGGDFDVAFHHDRYKALTASIIQGHGLEQHAPALRRGDVLLWNAKTIHGSLPTTEPKRSRSSFTAHFIPQSHRLLQFQSRIRKIEHHVVNGMRVGHPKDQDRLANRVVLGLEATYPRAFRAVRNAAVKLITR